MRERDFEAFDEVKRYSQMVYAMVAGKLSIEELINRAEAIPIFGTVVMAGALENIGASISLYPSDDW